MILTKNSTLSARARSSRTSSSPTKTTGRRPRCRAPCSRRCRNGRSRSANRRSNSRNCSSSWRRRTRSSRRTYPLEAQGPVMLKVRTIIRAMRKNGYHAAEHRRQHAGREPCGGPGEHPEGPRGGARRVYGREDRTVHPRHRLCHARAEEFQTRKALGPHQLRRFTPRDDQPGPRVEGVRIHQAARVRGAGRREGDLPRRPAPPHRPHVRGGGRERDVGTDHRRHPERGRGA